MSDEWGGFAANIRDCNEGGEEESVFLVFLVFLGARVSETLVRLSSESSSLFSWQRLGIGRGNQI